MSTQAQQVPPLTATPERRFYPRIAPKAPIFVAFHQTKSEELLLLNVSENGLLVSTPICLTSNFVARLSLPLKGLPKPVQVTVRVVWASEDRNLSGIQLLDLSEHDRQQIRKWGALESASALHSQPDGTLLVAPPVPASSESAGDAHGFAEHPLHNTSTHDDAAASPQVVPARRAPRRALHIAFLAAASLVVAVLLIKASPGNPFARFRQDRGPNTVVASLAPEVRSAPALVPVPDNTKPVSANPPASPTPPPNPTKPKTHSARVSVPQEPQQIEQAAADDDQPDSPVDTSQDQSTDAPAQSDLPATPTAASAVTPISPSAVAATPETPSASLNAARANGAPMATPLATPSNPLSNAAVPAPPPPSPRPAAPALSPVIQMDAPPAQTLQVHLPSGYQAPFFSLPGERVLESPAVTAHIQRSVHLPATHAGWPFNRNKKVVVGELISRADPLPAQISSGTAASVRVKATIAKDGHIANINQILGPPNLVAAVNQALHQWRYQPTLVDGNPVETQCYVVFQFHAPSYRAAKRQP